MQEKSRRKDWHAHLQHEMRKYTATCKHYIRGHCRLGSRCAFAHPGSPDHPKPRSYAVPEPFKCMAWQRVDLGDGRRILLTDFDGVPPPHGGFPERSSNRASLQAGSQVASFQLKDFPPLPGHDAPVATYRDVVKTAIRRPPPLDLKAACANQVAVANCDGARAPPPMRAPGELEDKNEDNREKTIEEKTREEDPEDEDFYVVL